LLQSQKVCTLNSVIAQHTVCWQKKCVHFRKSSWRRACVFEKRVRFCYSLSLPRRVR